MMLQLRFARKRLRKARSELISMWLLKYNRCVSKLKKRLLDKSQVELERRKTQAKLQPLPDDSTSVLFRETLSDSENFDYRLLDEVQFAKSVDKITLLENHVIDQFYIRRRSSGSFRSSFRSNA
ncbi:hypothetical protein OSTOST_22090 [Ostertagia ostertagi]